VTPIDDLAAESQETLVVTLASGPGHVVGREATAVVVIADDDTTTGGDTLAPADAARFLAHATLGPTTTTIEDLRSKGYVAWFDEQERAPVSSFLGYLDGITSGFVVQSRLEKAWFGAAVSGPDQLRQRVANALLEILVVSDAGGLGGDDATEGLAAYMDILARHAFGNFRTLLEDVTLSPAMGIYLDMMGNDKEDPSTGRNPNENYARELLQLFSIGLFELDIDGTLRLDASGAPIPTYGQAEIRAFAKALTGWTTYQASEPYVLTGALTDWRRPMLALAAHHSDGAKTLLGGVTLPAGQGPLADLQGALDVVFNHPNVGPFLAFRLIQRLVTSNPSRGYVARVASVFNDNGAGVRGDLKAVVRAILLDAEARQPVSADGPAFGHVKEPMFRLTHLLRAFNASSASGIFKMWGVKERMGQAAFRSPTVFNFFPPSYAPPGPIAAAQLVAPEFEITSQTTAVQYANTVRELVYSGYQAAYPGFGPVPEPVTLDVSIEQQLAATPEALLDRLDLVLLQGRLSRELRQIVLDAVSALPAADSLGRARLAVYLLATSPEFVVQR
jgi:uncharacterized protein (DUF1800 family)